MNEFLGTDLTAHTVNNEATFQTHSKIKAWQSMSWPRNTYRHLRSHHCQSQRQLTRNDLGKRLRFPRKDTITLYLYKRTGALGCYASRKVTKCRKRLP